MIMLFLSAAALLCSCGQRTYTIGYDPEIKDYTPVVKKILEENPKGNISIHFTEGTYSFYPENAVTEFLSMSNNDSGERKVVFLIKDMKNVRVTARGADFLFHGALVPFALKNSEDVFLEGFTVDYDYPWTFEGEVIANDPVKHTFTVKVFPDNKFRIEGDRLFFGGYDWEYPLAENIVFDPKTRRPYYNTAIYEHRHWAGEMKARELAEGIIEFSGVSSVEVPPVGSIWDDKGPMDLNRSHPGIAILQSKGVEISDIHVYKAGAMALIAEFSEDITVRRMSTASRPGSPRMITISADATHFVDCKGTVTLEGCTFESMLDDATNVHGIYIKVDSLLSPTKFTTSFGHFQQEGDWFADEGDLLRFIDRKSLRPVGEGRLLNIDKSDRKSYVLETDFDLSQFDSPERLAVENTTRGCSVVIKDCKVRYNRARSLLLSTSGDVLVEGCEFSSMMAGIRICGDANYWYESGRTRNVIIRSNSFTDGGLGGGQPQAILQIDPVIPKDARGNDFFFHGNIVFTGNTVRTFDRQVVYGLSVKNLEITDNVFIDSGLYPPLFPGLSVIDLQYCGNVKIEGNDFTRWQQDATISIHNCENVQNDTRLPVVDSPNPYFYAS